MKLRLLLLMLVLNSTAFADLVQNAYIKASHPDQGDAFGMAVAVSGDTMVVGAPYEDGGGVGVNAPVDDTVTDSGAAYVFVRSGSTWVQQAILKASNTDADDQFGTSVAIFGDAIAVGAIGESSNATGINGDQANDSLAGAGAVYIFVRNGTTWTQQAYVKPGNPDVGDAFGFQVALSAGHLAVSAPYEDSEGSEAGAVYTFRRLAVSLIPGVVLHPTDGDADDFFGQSLSIDGNTLVVGAYGESSNATGVNGNQFNNSALNSGAAYVFYYNTFNISWSHQAYLKASNTGPSDRFGNSVSISNNTIVVGAPGEDSLANGVNGNEASNFAPTSGAAYIFVRNSTTWSQQAYVKSSNTREDSQFGYAVCVNGERLLVSANIEDGGATGVNGGYVAPPLNNSGAAYLFHRRGGDWNFGAYIKAHNPKAINGFGSDLALDNQTAVITSVNESGISSGINGNAQQDPSVASQSGAAYAFDLQLPSLAKTGTAAPGAPNITFSTIGSSAVNADGEVIWLQTLGGSGSAGGKNRAVFSTLAPGNDAVDLVAQSGTIPIGNGLTSTARYVSFAQPNGHRPGRGLFQAVIGGSGIRSQNNPMLAVDDGAYANVFKQMGSNTLLSGNPIDKRYLYVLPHPVEDLVFVGYRLRNTSSSPVSASSDTGVGIKTYEGNTAVDTAPREGQPAYGGGALFGQLGPLSGTNLLVPYFYFSAIRIPTVVAPPANAIFYKDDDGSNTGMVVKIGDAAAGAVGSNFKTFTGLSGGLADVIFKATISNSPSTENEGLWNGSGLVVRKGEYLFNNVAGGLKIAKIIRFWPVNVFFNTQVVVQVILSGPNATSANNQALLLIKNDGGHSILMQTGEDAPGIKGGLISSISAVDVNPSSGRYVILGTLKGVPSGSNQALWFGNTQLGSDTFDMNLRLPQIKLRKGAYYSSPKSPGSFIRSMSIKPGIDATGSGGRGLAQAVGADGTTAVYLTNSAGAVELIALRP
jgi:hypothetical protein